MQRADKAEPGVQATALKAASLASPGGQGLARWGFQGGNLGLKDVDNFPAPLPSASSSLEEPTTPVVNAPCLLNSSCEISLQTLWPSWQGPVAPTAGTEAGIQKLAKKLPAPLVNWAAGFGPPGMFSH